MKRLLVASLALAGLVAATEPAVAADSACVSPPRPSRVLAAHVERVVDGDTIVVRLDERLETVRLLGVDTPEVHPSQKLARDVSRSGQDTATMRALGRQASAYTKGRLGDQPIELERDVRSRDRNGRLLAYVWHRDGTLFNLAILRDGYAQVLTVPPNVRYEAIFLGCQREARTAQRGLWAR